MHKHWKPFVIALAVIGAFAIAAFVLELHKGNFVHATAAELRERIAHDLPRGTPFSVVQRWANAAFPQTGFHGADGTLWALYPAAQSDGLVRTDLYVEFYFDRDERLTGATVTERYTGP